MDSTFSGRDLADCLYENENHEKPQGWGGNDRGGCSEAMLLGLDYQTGAVRWRFTWEGSGSTRSGLLATAGNLLFCGRFGGQLRRLRRGARRPAVACRAACLDHQRPIAYQLDGIQYIVVAANDTPYAFSAAGR